MQALAKRHKLRVGAHVGHQGEHVLSAVRNRMAGRKMRHDDSKVALLLLVQLPITANSNLARSCSLCCQCPTTVMNIQAPSPAPLETLAGKPVGLQLGKIIARMVRRARQRA